MNDQLYGRYYDLSMEVDTLKHSYNEGRAQLLKSRMLETATLGRELVDGILNKY